MIYFEIFILLLGKIKVLVNLDQQLVNHLIKTEPDSMEFFRIIKEDVS